jgi:MOSC domain-containing protein YiiM
VSSPARIVSVNVGTPREVEWFGRTVRTAIWKEPVTRRVPVHGVNLDGDDQADRRVHGGADKAVYSYAAEDDAWWSDRLGRALGPGTFGENLTTEGIDLTDAWIGERWQVGTVVLEVSQPREPCFKLGMRMGDAGFVDEFAAAGRPGAYLRIVEAGTLGTGDPVTVVDRPATRLTIGELASAGHSDDPELLRRIVAHDAVPDGWRRHALRALRHR